MKERPILFSGPMVRAILDGNKTQTRRVAPIRELNTLQHIGNLLTWSVSFLKPVKGVLSSHSGGKFSDLQARSIIASQFNPYGQSGDRLWVRETWGARFTHSDLGSVAVHWNDLRGQLARYRTLENLALYAMKADGQSCGGWVPSIHMPRWASRITLEITGVRVERLQDISEADAVAEGIEPFTDFQKSGHWRRYDKSTFNSYVSNPVESYASLWESINGPGSWDANPWVWVVEFKKVPA